MKADKFRIFGLSHLGSERIFVVRVVGDSFARLEGEFDIFYD